jgi:hypothetical protein
VTRVDPSNFEVITEDARGLPTRCSFCAQGPLPVVVLPLTQRPELEDRIAAADGEALWMGLCAYCVLAMAEALAKAKGSAA